MKQFIVLFLMGIMIPLGGGAVNRPTDRELRQAIDSIYRPVYPNPLEPGAAIAVVKDGNILAMNCYGVADLNTLAPITSATQFCIASLSKQFAAIALLQLCADGRISLDDRLSKFFPEWESPVLSQVTLHHILCHTSGIPDARPRTDRNFVLYSTDIESAAYIERLQQLNFSPGSKYEYINPTYQLIYQIIPRVTGQDFESYMQQHIFDPAGMARTAYFEPDRHFQSPAHGYTPDKAGGYREYDYGEETFFATKADGALYTSIADFIRWQQTLASGRILPLTWLKKAFAPHITIQPGANYGYQPYTGYGYGFFIQQRPGRPDVVYHTGDNGGFTIYAATIPDQRLQLLFFSTRDNIDRMGLVNTTLDWLERHNWLNNR